VALGETCRFTPARAHFRYRSIRETSAEVGDKFWSAVGAEFGGRTAGLFAVELTMDGALFIGSTAANEVAVAVAGV
jgi:hypothetical protein